MAPPFPACGRAVARRAEEVLPACKRRLEPLSLILPPQQDSGKSWSFRLRGLLRDFCGLPGLILDLAERQGRDLYSRGLFRI